MRLRGEVDDWQLEARQSNVALLTTLLASLLLLLILPCLWVQPNVHWMSRIHKQNSVRNVHYVHDSGERIGAWHGGEGWEEHRQSMELYAKLVSIDPDSRSARADTELLDRLERRCEPMTDLERVSDKTCRAWWQYVLQRQPVDALGVMLGFYKDRKQGAIQLKFKNGMHGWFKPCGTNSEPVEGEAIGSMVDFLGGFNRAAPVAMRNISSHELVDVAKRNAWYYPWAPEYHMALQTAEHCSFDDGTLYGSVIGWWTGVEQGLSIPKKVNMWDDGSDGLDFAAEAMPDQLLAEVVHDHVFFYLVNIARDPGKNEHMIYEQRSAGQAPLPTLLAIDLDRINTSGKTKASSFAVCRMCKIGRYTLRQLEKMSSVSAATFNSLLDDTLHFDEFPISVGTGGEVIHWRAQQMYQCFLDCIAARGRNQVVIPDDVWR